MQKANFTHPTMRAKLDAAMRAAGAASAADGYGSAPIYNARGAVAVRVCHIRGCAIPGANGFHFITPGGRYLTPAVRAALREKM